MKHNIHGKTSKFRFRKKKVDNRKIFEVTSRPGAARYEVLMAHDQEQN